MTIGAKGSTRQHLMYSVMLKTGVTENLIRLSVGIETVNDLLEDLDQELNKV